MIDDELIGQLMRWRQAQAEILAPPAPRGSRLLNLFELARPWWQIRPEQFQALWARLGMIQVVYGHAMVETRVPRGNGHPVPALIVRAEEMEVEASVSVLYLAIRDTRMSFRFHLEVLSGHADARFELTFVSEASALPLFCGYATRSVDSEYWLDTELTEEIAREWKDLRVMDRMPFRLILRSPLSAD